MPQDNTVKMEGVRIIFRNFAGREDMYNRKGDRNFGVLLDDDVAEQMAADGWNVKWLDSREEDEPKQAMLSVSVKFEGYPPRVVMITSRGGTVLTEETIERLDQVDIANVDMIVRPYSWEVNGKSGIKAYLQSMYITIEEDDLELKYADLDVQ